MVLTAASDSSNMSLPWEFARATTIVKEVVEDATNLWSVELDANPVATVVCAAVLCPIC